MYINMGKICKEAARIHGVSQAEVKREIEAALKYADRPNWRKGMSAREVFGYLADLALVRAKRTLETQNNRS